MALVLRIRAGLVLRKYTTYFLQLMDDGYGQIEIVGDDFQLKLVRERIAEEGLRTGYEVREHPYVPEDREERYVVLRNIGT